MHASQYALQVNYGKNKGLQSLQVDMIKIFWNLFACTAFFLSNQSHQFFFLNLCSAKLTVLNELHNYTFQPEAIHPYFCKES